MTGTGVRIVASPDLDVLNNRTVTSKLLTALGGEWTPDIDSLYTRATQDFQGPPAKLLNKNVRALLDNILDEAPEALFDGSQADRVKAALKMSNPWDALKQRGKPAMNADKPAREDLLGRLDDAGLVTVTVGELENFDLDATRSSKDAWLEEALAHGAHTTENVASHIRRLLHADPPPEEESVDA